MSLKRFLIKEQARANTFNMFSALFCQPEDEIVKNPDLFKSLRQLFMLLKIKNIDKLSEFEKSVNKYTETELLVEYAKLFVGPFKTLAPPYSSIYLGEPTVMSDDTIWVLNQYRKMELDFNDEVRDLPDHIAVESEYLYYLIFNEIKNLKEDQIEKAKKFYEAQEVFLTQHFNKWVPRFCDHGVKSTQNEYYKNVFKSLDRFTRSKTLDPFPL